MQNFFVERKKSGSPGPRVSIGSHSSRKKKNLIKPSIQIQLKILKLSEYLVLSF